MLRRGHLPRSIRTASFGPSNIPSSGPERRGWGVQLEGITWPAVAGLASYVLFVATQDD